MTVLVCHNDNSDGAEERAAYSGRSLRAASPALPAQLTPALPRAVIALPPPLLSPRMVSCLEWASQGKSSVDIGQLLGISPRTVDDYLTECRRRLDVRTRVQAIVKAVALGLIRTTPV